MSEEERLRQRNAELEALVQELQAQLQASPSHRFALSSIPLPLDRPIGSEESRVARSDDRTAVAQLQSEILRRKWIQESLRASEERYRSVIAAMQEGILTLTADGTIQTCNASAEKILEQSAETLIAQNFRDLRWQLVHEDSSDFEIADFPGLLSIRTGIPCSEVVLGLRKSARHTTWLSVNSQPLFREGELMPYGVVVSFSDITLRKWVEQERSQLLAREQAAREQAEQAREQISQILQSITDGFMAFDRDSRFTYVNHEAARTLGRSSRDLLGKNLWQVLPNFGDTSFGRIYRRALADGVPLETVDYYAPWDCWYAVRAYPSKAGVSLFFRNLTDSMRTAHERDQAQEALREAMQRLNLHVENSPFAIVEWDRHLRITRWSQQAETLFGWTAEEVVGKPLSSWNFVVPEDVEIVDRTIAGLLNGQATHNLCVNRNYTKAGSIVHCEWYNSVLFDEAGELVSVMSLVLNVSDRKQAEEELRLMQSVVVKANDAVVITEAEPMEPPGPRVVYVNDAFTRMMGYERHEVIGKTPRILQGSKTDWKVLEKIRTALKNWEPAIEELVNYHKDGSEVWIELSIFPVTDDSGRYTYWVGLQRDITHRKQAEEAIRRQNWRSQLFADITLKIRQSLQLEEILQTTVTEVRNLLQTDRVLIYRLLPQQKGIVCNEAVSDTWESLLNQAFPPHIFLVDENAPSCPTIQAIADVATESALTELLPFFRDISVKAMLIVPIVQQDSLWGLLIAQQCETSRQWSDFEIELLQQLANQVEIALTQSQLLHALRESEERFRTLANSAPVLLWMLNKRGGRAFCNQSLLDFTGRTLEQEKGTGWQDNVHPADLPHCQKTYKKALTTRSSFEMEYRLRRADGEYRWVLDRGTPRTLPDGTFGGHIGSCIDITDRKQAEVEMQRALLKERELSELKSRFVSTTSHEFRTPLSTILSSADLLEFYAGNCPPEKQLEHIQRIQSAALNMNNLLNDVLMIERAEAKKIRFEPVRFDLRSFCQTLVEEMRLNDHGKHRLFFESEQTSPIPACMDEKLLRQICTNLISNALKYSPIGSKVKFRLSTDRNEAYISVQDEGIGISEEDQVRLFEPFHRGNNVGMVSGNGLGLAIVKQSVDAHSGEITVRSQPHQGTTVSVTLPLMSSAVSSANAAQRRDRQDSH